MRWLIVVSSWLLVVGCAASEEAAWQAPQRLPGDTLAVRLPKGGKYKFTGPVNITYQQGNGNVATPTATAKVKAQAAAVGPNAQASATRNGVSWKLLAVVVVLSLLLGAAVWEYLSHAGLLKWLPWRVKPG